MSTARVDGKSAHGSNRVDLDDVELGAQIENGFGKLFRTRTRSGNDDGSAVAIRRIGVRPSRLGKDRAQSFARFEHALHVNDVGRPHSRADHEELIAEQRFDPRFAVHEAWSYSISVVPEN